MHFAKGSAVLLVIILILSSGHVLADIKDQAKLGKAELILDGNLNAPELLSPMPTRANELDYLGDTVIVGITQWDSQHNSTVGRMIQYDPNYNDGEGQAYVVFTDLPSGGNAIRKVRVSKIGYNDGVPYEVTGTGGAIVNDGHWGGYATLAMSPTSENPLPVACYHARPGSNDPYFTRAAVEWTLFPDIYIETIVPWLEEGILIWPVSAMDGDSVLHVVSTTSEGGTGIHYSRMSYDPNSQLFTMTNPGGHPEMITDMPNFISADLAVSPDGQRVCISHTANRYDLGINPEEHDNDNDLLIWSNNERGLNWDWNVENAINVTQFQGPNYDFLPGDTMAANVDTFRLWLESQCYLDDDNVLHAMFSVSENFYIQNSGLVFSQIYYWNEEDNLYIRVADGSFWNNQGAALGVNNVLVQRPSMYKDPETDWIWAVFQQFGVPGDTTADGSALDVNSEGRPCAEIFLTASPSGYFNGKLWFNPINISQSRSESTAIDPGDCQSERDPSISLNNDGEYLHISYLVDKDSGTSISDTPEGVRTDNPMVYQRLSKAEMIQRFYDQGYIDNYPLHADSTGYWELAIEEEEYALLPDQFNIESVYPNPFNATARVNFSLSRRGQVSLKIYDILGREVASMLNRVMEVGTHEVTFNGTDLASGIYFVELASYNQAQTQKIILLK